MGRFEDAENPVVTSVTSFEVIEALKQLEGATVSEVADELDVAVSTAHRHLATLVGQGFAVREDNQYRVGLRFLEYGVFARSQLPYYEIANNQVDTLVEETSEKIRLTALEDDFAVLLYRRMGAHPLMTSSAIGGRRHLHQLAAGKAILAGLSDSEVRRIIERRGLPARTEATITSEDGLFEQLETIRDRGYAFNLGESVDGLHAVGAAFTNDDGRPLGALSIAGPANRLTRDVLEGELSTRLLGAINEVEINYKYASDRSPA